MNAPSKAFIARTRLPDATPGPRKVQRAERLPNSVSLEELERRQRTYRVTYKRDFSGWGLDWTLTIGGKGDWCEGSNGTGGPGLGGKFRTRDEANEVGRKWVRDGRTK